MWTPLLSRKKCVITASTMEEHGLSTQTQERNLIGYMIWLYAAEYKRQYATQHGAWYLWSVIHDTPKVASYFRSIDTLRIQWPFLLHTGRRCFPFAVEYLNPIKIDHVTLWWAAVNRCDRARESVCPQSCSSGFIWAAQFTFICLCWCFVSQLII